MIKINLAGALEKLPSSTVLTNVPVDVDLMTPDEIQKKGVVKLLMLLILPIALYIYETQNLPAKSKKISRLNQSMQELQTFNAKADPIKAEMEKFSNDEKKIQQRIKTIEDLSQDRLVKIQILDIIQQIIPKRVWINKIEVVDNRFSITGLGINDFEISGFQESLERSVYVQNLRPGTVSETLYEGVPVKSFEVSFSVGVPQ